MSNKQFPTRDRISRCRALVVGDVMLDRYWHGDVSRISGEAPVPVVNVRHEEIRLGGAANVALNIKSLGGHVTLMSMVGQDDAAFKLRSLLDECGIETYLGEDPSMETIVKLRVISRNQQLLRIDFEKEPDHEVLLAMLNHYKEIVGEYDVVLFSDYAKGGLTHIPEMVRLARDAGKKVLIDPKGSNWERYSGASVITPNRSELIQVTGPWSSEVELQVKVRAICKKLGLGALLLTRSEDGVTLFEADRVSSISAVTREVSDVTGAGDTVIGTMGLMLACSIDLLRAVSIANLAAGLVVAKFGTASLSYDELYECCTDEH